MKVAGACIVFIYLFSYVCADTYMQNPRGSNDRLNEGNTDRNNANRLFDSQNNARGGYCYGPALSFYEGSRLSIEWTSQHACRNEKVYCNMVIQYMCGEKDADPMIRIRDGLTTNTITDSPTGPTTTDPNNPGELLYGMHESYQYYQDCKCRKRNLGLWISDRKTEGGLDPNNRPTAIFTRQNNGGNRHGYECAEERDYYPYWAPSPWKDIAILTDDMAYCNFYKSESQNVKGRGYCTLPSTAAAGSQVPNNEGECGQSQGTWTTAPSHGLPAPDCVMAPYSRDNHLGNGNTGYANSYNWTLPRLGTESCIDKDNCACVLRIRYNISTSDLNNLKSGKTIDGNSPYPEFIDAKSNEGNSPIHNDQISPYAGTPFGFQLAMDTSQYGRTFQDRSHVFRIKPRPSNIDANARIYNLNVRGKRGNIQQTFPGTEYDFVPENLNVHTGDYIHFQWTGCDTNPTGYAGEGTDRWDRSNIVQIEDPAANVPASDDWLSSHDAMFTDLATRQRMAMIDQDPSTCLSWDALLTKNGNNENNAKQDVQNCMKLNAAPTPYFDGGAIQMNTANSFYYMSSRNNNFSNRGHKAVIHVTDFLDAWAIGVVSAGAALFVGGAGIAGATFYAKSHPHSSIANFLSKF